MLRPLAVGSGSHGSAVRVSRSASGWHGTMSISLSPSRCLADHCAAEDLRRLRYA